MADTPKKTTRTTATKTATASKPRKAATKKTAEAATADPTSNNGHAVTQGRSVRHDDVAKLAHTYWQQRGGKHGHHEEDWYRAEQELSNKTS